MMWVHMEGKHLPCWALSTGLCSLWVEAFTFSEPGHEGCWPLSPPWNPWKLMVGIFQMFMAWVADLLVSRLNQGLRKDLTPLLWHLLGWEAFTIPRDCFQQPMCSWLGMSKRLNWATSPIQKIAIILLQVPLRSHGYSGHLWIPCQVQKTKVDPRTVGHFWRLDRITAGEEAFTGHRRDLV